MRRNLHTFTAKRVETLGPGVHNDGGGLMLRVQKTATAHTGRSWVFRYWLHGRERRMGLGSYPRVTLKDAREKAADARRLLDRGVDPLAERQEDRRRALAEHAKAVTFKEAAEKLIAAKAPEWKNAKHAAQWRSTLETYAYPVIGRLPVADIEFAHIKKILEPIWSQKVETASRLRGRIEAVLAWATTSGFRTGDNPARWTNGLEHHLPSPARVKKNAGASGFGAMPYDDVPAFMGKLKDRSGAAAEALAFTIHTAARSGEVRGMTWAEVDLGERVWTIPAGRMKAGAEHRKPLSDAAVRILQSRRQRHGSEGFVFASDMASKDGQQKPMSDMTLGAVLKRMKLEGVTVHGFRASFRTWAAEETDHPSWVAEMALAHTVKGIEAHYQRGDLMDKRRALAADWSAFVEGAA
ncbi:MAG: integrase arm-type DNA-binding domain-containing protein [Alphaproteobacteria bacterium]|nr:integrase arm-type DNA-binding domain-containing protein [Alphaproteobacteria bacterium]